MSVYVDPLFNAPQYRKSANERWEWKQACHLRADTEKELHAFASRLGLKREWFQSKSKPHYDLTANKRRQAVKFGAIEISHQELAALKTEMQA